MEDKQFKRTIEDFACLHCGTEVTGDGYTNHCPYCLWSKHVDINPGDRKEGCQGGMRPINIITNAGKHRIEHQCEICGEKRLIDTRPEDNFDAILSISKGE